MTVREDVIAFMEEFAALFSPALLDDPQKFERLMEYYFQPFTVFDADSRLPISESGKSVVVQNEDKLRSALTAGMQANLKNGWETTKTDSYDVHVVNDTLVIVTRRFTRYRQDETSMDRGYAATYTVVKKDGRWRVAIAVIHDPHQNVE